MKLEMGDPDRERPDIEDSLATHPQNIKAEMKEEITLNVEKTSEQQWNIPCKMEASGLDLLMSKMSLDSDRRRALCRLVRLALSRADHTELKELEHTAAQKYGTEFVRSLRSLLDKGSKVQDGESDVEPSKRHTTLVANLLRQTSEDRRDKPKKNSIEELREESDLCPRSPMRPQHQRPSNFPYQNTSRNHHSGGIMSAVACSDAVGPTPQYHNLPSYSSLGSLASRPPIITETSNMVTEMTSNDLDAMVNLSEGDLQILMSLAVDLCPKISPDYECLPESILEINSSPDSREVDHRVPTELHPSPGTLDPWGGGYYDDSTSGCSSLSPNSLHSFSPSVHHLPSSPDSNRLVPDDSAPNMSPPGQFFDDRLPMSADYDLNVYAKRIDRSPGSSGYSSTGIPSPTEYPPANEHSTEDFDTKVQIASNDYFCNLDEDFNSDYLLPEFENVFDYASTEAFANSEATSAYTATTNVFTPTTNVYTPTTNGYTPAISAYTATTRDYTATTNVYTPTTNVYTATTRDYTATTNVYTPTTRDYTPAMTAYTATTIASIDTQNVADYGSSLAKIGADTPTFTPLMNVPSYPVYVDPTPSTVNSTNLKLAMPVAAKLVSPAISNLKRLEPKLEHYLRPESGRERILKLMDKKKKAKAWANIALKINELAKQDKDGDTQLMILLANPDSNAQSFVLEYTYAMVEMSKSFPRALTSVNIQGESALWLAAIQSEHSERAILVRYIAETLVELGEEVAHTSEGGDSILHEVCRQGDQRYDVLVELLSLKNKAGQPYFDVNLYNAKGLTPLHIAVKAHGYNNVTSLMTVQLLMAERADVSLPEKSGSNTSLHLAIKRSCAPRLLEVMLRCPSQAGGRACNTLNFDRDSCLHCAASRNDLPVAQQMKVIQLLLENGAVKSLNAAGKFPIALVAEERRQEIRRVYDTRRGSQANVAAM